MAVVQVKSTAITNRDASPRVHNSSYLQAGQLRQSVGTVLVTTGDTSTSTYIMGEVPSNARLSSISLWSDAMGTGTTLDLGIWQNTANGSASVSPTLFASGLNIHTAAIAGTNEMFSALTVDNVEKRIWELLGLSADPEISYDVVGRLAVTADAGGKLTLKIDYVI